jgi:3-oxoacyl-[acyl-carrier protein] reductase
MDFGITGRRALVTAASRGIGRACALALAAEGAKLSICARGRADLDATLAALGGEDAGHRALAIDLASDGGPAMLLSWLAEDALPDIAVHSLGGTLDVRDSLPTEHQWRSVFRLNFEVAAELNATLVPEMVRRRSGRICAISSLAAFEMHGSLAYGVAKAALTAYTRGLGRAYADTGVVISAVVPGVVLTEGGHWEQNRRRDPQYVENYIKERIPRGAFGSAEEVAAAVTFLCSRHAAPFIGSIVPLEGGQARSFFGQ